MSVMCSVYVSEGIVLACDSRMTANVVAKPQEEGVPGINAMFTLSDNAQKVVLLSKVNIGIAACGAGILKNRSVSDYLRAFEAEQVLKGDTAYSVAKKLTAYSAEFEKIVRFFVAGYEADEPFLYLIENGELKRLNTTPQGKAFYGASWSGESVTINKLINGEPKMQIDFNIFPLKDAIDFAECMVKLTIDYQRFETKPKTCGGDVDVLVLTKNDAFWHKHKVFARS